MHRAFYRKANLYFKNINYPYFFHSLFAVNLLKLLIFRDFFYKFSIFWVKLVIFLGHKNNFITKYISHYLNENNFYDKIYGHSYTVSYFHQFLLYFQMFQLTQNLPIHVFNIIYFAMLPVYLYLFQFKYANEFCR